MIWEKYILLMLLVKNKKKLVDLLNMLKVKIVGHSIFKLSNYETGKAIINSI